MNKPIIRLKEIGVDTDEIVSRLGGNEQLYWSICKKFITDQNYRLFISSLGEKDEKAAEIHIHTLKGVAANLGFRNLNLICQSLLYGLKNADNQHNDPLVIELTKEYERIISVLKEEA